MNNGDKVICIKTVCSINKMHILLKAEQTYLIKLYSYGAEFYQDNLLICYLPYDEFLDCIITLAEWREQQMKMVLDE
jgi:hypothetical protein